MADDPETPETPEVVDAEAVEESKPLPKDLVVRGAAVDDQAVYRVFDRHDEEQILDELVGRQLATMVYSYGSGANKVTDLSYVGVLETVRTLNARGATRIEVAADPRPEFEEAMEGEEAYVVCTVYARDTLNGGGGWGTASQSKRMKLKNGNMVPDSFARNKALSKASRNAEKTLIPEEFKQLLIARFLKDETKIRQIREGLLTEDDLPQLPPPLEDDDMKRKMAEVRGLYEEITKLCPGGVAVKLTPASFHRYSTRAETSHERADGFLGLLREKLDEAKEAAK